MSEVVHQHFSRVREQWEDFAENTDARVLCWSIANDGFDILRAFYEYESSESKELPHLFLPCDQPLEEGSGIESILKENLNALLQELSEDEESEETIELEDRVKAYCDHLSSLADHFDDCVDIVCSNFFAETPIFHQTIKGWLEKVLESDRWDSRIRITLLEDAQNPQYDSFTEDYEGKFIRKNLNVSVADIAEQVADDNPAQGSGPDFQRAFTALNQAVSTGDAKKTQQKAEQANQIAEKENWPSMQVAIAFQLGAGASNQQDFDSALLHYQDAEKYSQKSKEMGEPGANKLHYQSLLAQASVEVPREYYSKASALYQQAAEIATEEKEPMVAMDSWRMASFCHERLLTHKDQDPLEVLDFYENRQLAWQYAQQAMVAAMELEEDLREVSTAPYLGDALLRIRDIHRYDDENIHLEKQLEQLLGQDWKSKVEQVRS